MTMREADTERSRKALLEQLERSGIPATARHVQSLHRIVAEFDGDALRMAVEIKTLRADLEK
jgi:hypothetical protein